MLRDQTNRLKRPPRLGKIKIGLKAESGHPKGIDYFIIESDYADKVYEVYGDKPRSLNIVFPFDDIEDNLDEMYRMYSKSGLKCTGDGVMNREADVNGKLIEQYNKCPCDFYKPISPEHKQQCFATMRMSFIITGIGVTGFWQFSSKSIFTMSNMRSIMEMVQLTTGRLAGVKFVLNVKMQTSTIANNPHRFPVVSIDCPFELSDIAQDKKQLAAPAKQIEEPKEIEPEPADTIQNSANDEEKKDYPKFKSVLVQAKWNEFDRWLEDNKAELPPTIYKSTREWLDALDDRTDTKQLTINLDKVKKQLGRKPVQSGGKYKTYHDELITECGIVANLSDRPKIITLLNDLVKRWKIDGKAELSDATENECQNLLEEFEKIHKHESLEEVLENDHPSPAHQDITVPDQNDDDLPF